MDTDCGTSRPYCCSSSNSSSCQPGGVAKQKERQWRETRPAYLPFEASAHTSLRGPWFCRQPWLLHIVPLFKPFFVEAAFWSQYVRHMLLPYDRVGLFVAVAVWAACCVAFVPLSPVVGLMNVGCMLFAIALLALYHLRPTVYAAHRRLLITCARALGLAAVVGSLSTKPTPPTAGPWLMALTNLLVRSGGMYCSTSFMMVDAWAIAALGALLNILVLSTTMPPAVCNLILAGPHPTAGWQAAAGLMDRTALGVYRTSLGQPHTQHAVCCSTLSTSMVLTNCCMVYVVHWGERVLRLRYKAQLPPAVAAMQEHVIALPWALAAAQGVLLVLYPACVAAWLLSGAWYGLWGAAA